MIRVRATMLRGRRGSCRLGRIVHGFESSCDGLVRDIEPE